ncbi:transglycosylase [Salmonella enterica subsp. enterica serovar Typhimurium]|nr:transglycosylase [Salmonella enterica subsp. enterica serovar Typhimurium]
MTLTIGVAVSLFKELKDLEQGAKDAGMDAGAFAVQKLQTKERERGYNGFIPRLKELLGMDTPIPQGRYQPYVPLTRLLAYSSELSRINAAQRTQSDI